MYSIPFRRFIVLSLIMPSFLLCSVLLAEPVNIEHVGNVTETFLKVHDLRQKKELKLLSMTGASKGPAVKFITTGITEIFSDSGKLLAYVTKLEPKGFIVTSTDTNITPIIAYSFNSNFPTEDEKNNTQNYTGSCAIQFLSFFQEDTCNVNPLREQLCHFLQK